MFIKVFKVFVTVPSKYLNNKDLTLLFSEQSANQKKYLNHSETEVEVEKQTAQST